ncbi:MAG: UDP-N-acetylmuramate dehydrogenase [Bacteroidales bacterium]|nr:UDP-N-acetylmuramate dehydrogenase [Bacteroidales bacterium]
MEKNFSLRELNTFGFDVKAKYFQELKSMDDIRELIDNPEFKQSRLLILSGGSNVLFSSEFFDGFVVYPNLKGIETLEETAETVKIRCYCGEVWKDFVDYNVAKNLYGLENLADIPGKVGAAPVQNIGAYGAEVKDTIYHVHTIDLATGQTKIFSDEECRFSYRNSVFKELISNRTTHALSQRDDKSLSVGTRHALYKSDGYPLIFAVDFVLKKHGELKLDYGNIRNYLASKNITNPTLQDVATTVKTIRAEKLPEVGVVGSVGSFFQNAIVSEEKYFELKKAYQEIPSYPVTAEPNEIPRFARNDKLVKIPSGWLIDKAGWKGYRENHVGVWDKQALVLVHYGGGKPQEILDLMKKIQDSVKDKFGVEIKPEVNIV